MEKQLSDAQIEVFNKTGRFYPHEIAEAKLQLFKNSCSKSCGPGDWYKGGKCDIHGCYCEEKS